MAPGTERLISADLDGDGRCDESVLGYDEPAVLRVWLSSVSLTEVIHAHRPLVRIVAVDLDGDSRPGNHR